VLALAYLLFVDPTQVAYVLGLSTGAIAEHARKAAWVIQADMVPSPTQGTALALATNTEVKCERDSDKVVG